MKTTAEKIAVMQAHEDGKEIECLLQGAWMVFENPTWDWAQFDYRVAEPKPDYINWDHVHERYKFMARDCTGLATLFIKRPDHYAFGWSVMLEEGETDAEKSICAVRAESHASYRNNGIDWKDSLVERPHVDVPQVKADRVVWRLIPEQYRYAARDKSGSVFLYENKPTMTPSEWFCGRQSHVNMSHFCGAFTKGSVPWDQSLIERPATA